MKESNTNMANLTFRELRDSLNDMSDAQLDQSITAFVIAGGANVAAPVRLQFEEGDALVENGLPYFLV